MERHDFYVGKQTHIHDLIIMLKEPLFLSLDSASIISTVLRYFH